MINTIHGRRFGQLCDVPRIPSLLELFGFYEGIMPSYLATPVPACETATLQLMEKGKPTEEVMAQLKRIFGGNEFDTVTAAAKMSRSRNSISGVLRAAAEHGLMTAREASPFGTVYYRIKA